MDLEAIAICIDCGKRLWREGALMQVRGKDGDGTMTVCPHCLNPFELLDGKWQHLSVEKLARAYHVLQPIALDYMRQQLLAAGEGLTLEEWQNRQPRREHMGQPQGRA